MRAQTSRLSAKGARKREVSPLGAVVRSRRRALRLSQAELASLANVGLAFMYELEQGKPTLRLDKLLDVLSVLGLELRVTQGKSRLSIDPELGPSGSDEP